MANEVTINQASGWFKKRYDPILRDLRPTSAPLVNMLPFDTKNKTGESYNVSVMLNPPNGFTYAGAGTTVLPLKGPRNMVSKQATVTGFELDLREQIQWKVFTQAVAKGEASFVEATSEIVLGMKIAAMNRVEASLLHGQRGYGTVDTGGVTDNGDNTANVVISTPTWAPGLWWAINVNSTWDTFAGTSKANSGGALVLVGINAAAKTLKFSFVGSIGTQIAAGNVLFPEGAYDGTTHADMPGLLSQAGNTTGTSLGISATTYPNWAGNTYNVNGPISHYVVEDAISTLRDRGANGKLIFVCSNKAFSVLVMELMAARMIDSSYNPNNQKTGAKKVTYVSAEVGEIEIVADPMMKWGEFLIIPVNDNMVTCRVGSTDITFDLTGTGKEFFQFVPGYNAAEMDCMSDQAVLTKKPNSSMLGTGITYPSAA